VKNKVRKRNREWDHLTAEEMEEKIDKLRKENPEFNRAWSDFLGALTIPGLKERKVKENRMKSERKTCLVSLKESQKVFYKKVIKFLLILWIVLTFFLLLVVEPSTKPLSPLFALLSCAKLFILIFIFRSAWYVSAKKRYK